MSGTKSEADLSKSYALNRARDAASKMSLMLSRMSLAQKGKRSRVDLLMRSNELPQKESLDSTDTEWLKGIIDAFKVGGIRIFLQIRNLLAKPKTRVYFIRITQKTELILNAKNSSGPVIHYIILKCPIKISTCTLTESIFFPITGSI